MFLTAAVVKKDAKSCNFKEHQTLGQVTGLFGAVPPTLLYLLTYFRS